MRLIVEIEERIEDGVLSGEFDAKVRIDKRDYDKENAMEDAMRHQAAMARMTLLTQRIKEEAESFYRAVNDADLENKPTSFRR